MTECTGKYYLKNGESFETASFDLKYINHGSSIYEVTRLTGNGVLFLKDHIERFCNSLKMEGVSPKTDCGDIPGHIQQLIRLNPAGEGNIKFVQNTTEANEQNFLVYFTAHRYPSEEDYSKGIKVITYPFERINPNKKIWRPAFRQDVTDLIRNHSAWEALLVDPKGFMPEASRSNLFALKNGRIITSPDQYILTGITRKYVLQACRELGIPIDLRLIHQQEIQEMDTLFLTSTSLQLMPLRQVDEQIIPVGHPQVDMIRSQFNKIKQNHLKKSFNPA